MQNKGVTLSIFHNGRGGYFFKKIITDPMVIIGDDD
jgi:hypothetical protein